jgi:hypothetical protein
VLDEMAHAALVGHVPLDDRLDHQLPRPVLGHQFQGLLIDDVGFGASRASAGPVPKPTAELLVVRAPGSGPRHSRVSAGYGRR